MTIANESAHVLNGVETGPSQKHFECRPVQQQLMVGQRDDFLRSRYLCPGLHAKDRAHELPLLVSARLQELRGQCFEIGDVDLQDASGA